MWGLPLNMAGGHSWAWCSMISVPNMAKGQELVPTAEKQTKTHTYTHTPERRPIDFNGFKRKIVELKK